MNERPSFRLELGETSEEVLQRIRGGEKLLSEESNPLSLIVHCFRLKPLKLRAAVEVLQSAFSNARRRQNLPELGVGRDPISSGFQKLLRLPELALGKERDDPLLDVGLLLPRKAM
jgi:hypothetical protein